MVLETRRMLARGRRRAFDKAGVGPAQMPALLVLGMPQRRLGRQGSLANWAPSESVGSDCLVGKGLTTGSKGLLAVFTEPPLLLAMVHAAGHRFGSPHLSSLGRVEGGDTWSLLGPSWKCCCLGPGAQTREGKTQMAQWAGLTYI